jgi:hypothetical protein
MAECTQQLNDAHQPNSGRISNGIDSRKFGLAQALSELFVLVTRQGRLAARYSPNPYDRFRWLLIGDSPTENQ